MKLTRKLSKNELTREQITHAVNFLMTMTDWKTGDFFMDGRDVAELLALYGGLRFDAAENRLGTLEEPGPFGVVKP